MDFTHGGSITEGFDLKDSSKLAANTFDNKLGISTVDLKKLVNIALEKGGDFADVYMEYAIRSSIIMEENIIKSSSRSVLMGVGIRVIKGGQTGYAYSEDPDFKALASAARTAASIATGARVKLHEAEQFNHVVPKNHYQIQHTISDLSMTEKIRLIQQTERYAYDHDPRIFKVIVSLADSLKFIQIATSEGQIMSDTRPMFRMSVQCIAKEGENVQSGSAGVGGRVGIPFLSETNHAKDIATKAAHQSLLLLSAKQAPSGIMPVILGPAQSGILLHEAVGHPLEADFNRKGTSAYSGRLGQKVASSLCTIYDSGVIEQDRGSLNFDDEGCLPQENLLIEKGILRGYMQDRISANYFKINPSGNGRRESYAYYPMPRMTTTYLANGESDPQEIIGSVKKGVYCESFNGGQVDISNGDFVFVPTVAYMIEDGKRTYPIKNFTLIGNGPDAMSKVDMVGNDFAYSEGIWTCGKDGQSVPVGVGLPTVLVSELTVGGMAG